MNKTDPNSPIYNNVRNSKIFTAVCAAVLFVLGCVSFLMFFDIEDMYLERCALTYILYGAVFAACIAAFVLCLALKPAAVPNTRRAGLILGCMCALAILPLVLDTLINRLSAEKPAMPILTVLLSLFAMIYFSGIARKNAILDTTLGILAVLWCVIIIGRTYFDNQIAMNSPYEIICQFGLGFTALLIISELKFDLGSSSGMYTFVSFCAFCINLLAVGASAVMIFRGWSELGIYTTPACAAAIYSSKLFFSHRISERTDTQENSTERTDIYENTEQ